MDIQNATYISLAFPPHLPPPRARRPWVLQNLCDKCCPSTKFGYRTEILAVSIVTVIESVALYMYQLAATHATNLLPDNHNVGVTTCTSQQQLVASARRQQTEDKSTRSCLNKSRVLLGKNFSANFTPLHKTQLVPWFSSVGLGGKKFEPTVRNYMFGRGFYKRYVDVFVF
ncbi:hypothetical protein PoB_004733300 [Plakobranchus ocellatus]|uniref:Uncharacterized protein n=1 Tax=Plakobranchus ocellatus TaxID=259542 RepID=A0AAV4BMN1_9GAST|nr:hypothetical protein PoB_004733300 [Plakobranchus ocellatus]